MILSYITYRGDILFSSTATPNYNRFITKGIPEFFLYSLTTCSLTWIGQNSATRLSKDTLIDRSANRLLRIETIYGVHEWLWPPSTF